MLKWKPHFERAIELPAAEVYAALRRGQITAKGVRLPDLDVAVSLKLLAEQGKTVGELDSVAIPKDFWSLRDIYWEISAARNVIEHYCHISCQTEEVLSVFPLHMVTMGEPVDGLMRHGSFFVLSPNSRGPAAPVRRSQVRSRSMGRPQKYQWADLHVEMAALIRNGLPTKKDAAIEQLRELYRKKHGDPVPSVRSLHDWLKPYYERYSEN
jgi:hypothetical protein